MKKRNIVIDIFRALSLLLVLIYHIWVVSGSFDIPFYPLKLIIKLGGELGVTGFFFTSGYGIFCSLNNSEQKGKISYIEFLKKRFKRIAPGYYLNLFIVIFIFNGGYLAKEHFTNILSHLFFVHNFWVTFHGAINGVLWTMGVIVQFYLIATILYKLLKKNPYVFVLASIAFTIVSKRVMLYNILPYYHLEAFNFQYGRQLITALDNFTMGMFVAWLVEVKQFKIKELYAYIGMLISAIMVWVVCYVGNKLGIHTQSTSGILWHSAIAVWLGGVVLFSSYIQIVNTKAFKPLLWLSKHEYGIYLWHLLIIYNLLGNSALVMTWVAEGKYLLIVIVLSFTSVTVGYVMDKFSSVF